MNSEFMPSSFSKNRRDPRPARVHPADCIENRDTDCTNLVQIQESVPPRETIPSIQIEHSVNKRNRATSRLLWNVLLRRIGLSIAIEASDVGCKKSISRNSRARVIKTHIGMCVVACKENVHISTLLRLCTRSCHTT